MRKKFKNLVISCISAIMTFAGIGSLLPALSEDTGPPQIDPMEHVTCYDMAMPVIPPELEIENLNQSLELLEKEYQENKINEETYNLRKIDLQKQIKIIKEGP